MTIYEPKYLYKDFHYKNCDYTQVWINQLMIRNEKFYEISWIFKLKIIIPHLANNYNKLGGFPGGSDGKESAYSSGDLGSIPV